MTTDEQVRILMKELRKGRPLTTAAANGDEPANAPQDGCLPRLILSPGALMRAATSNQMDGMPKQLGTSAGWQGGVKAIQDIGPFHGKSQRQTGGHQCRSQRNRSQEIRNA